MTKVSVVSVPIKDGKTAYYAVAGDKHTFGNTAGEALDALTTQMTEEKSSTLVIVQYHQPDQFFDEKQQQQLATLMAKWREAREQGQSLTERDRRIGVAILDQICTLPTDEHYGFSTIGR